MKGRWRQGAPPARRAHPGRHRGVFSDFLFHLGGERGRQERHEEKASHQVPPWASPVSP